MAAGHLVRRAYVAGVRGVRWPLRKLRLLDRLGRSKSRRTLWMRSLFAIYDLDDMERVGLPWWTFDAIDAVERHLGPAREKRVFEYGSGASTLWLADRAASVVSIEFDSEWHGRLSEKLANASHVDLRLVPATSTGTIGSAKPGFENQYFDDFVAAIEDEAEPFDVIVIDGRAREACLEASLPALAPGGIIVFDDTKRQRYKDAIAKCELESTAYNGLAVSLPFPDSTTLLTHRGTLAAS